MRSETVTAPATTVFPQGYVFTHVETELAITETIQDVYNMGQAEIALVAIDLSYKASEKNEQLRNRTEQSSRYLLQNLRPMVRKTDCVFLHNHTMYFVLLAANLQGAKIVEERLWDALLWRVHSMSEQELPRPLSLSIGHSAFPQPQTSVEDLLTAARRVSKHFGERTQKTWQRNAQATRTTESTRSDEQMEELPLLAKKLGIPYLTILPSRPPQRLLQVVDPRLARELHCYPVGRARNMLTVAMLNPRDHQALERLHRETGLLIFPVLTHPETLESALKQLG